MPTDKHGTGPSEKELSQLLQATEPPRSPAHVDALVLRQAREKAAALRADTGGDTWLLPRAWVPALATLSIAVVAVSITLQGVDEEAMLEPGGLDIAESQAPAIAPALQQQARQQAPVQAPPQAPQANQPAALAADAGLATASAPAERAATPEPLLALEEIEAEPAQARAELSATFLDDAVAPAEVVQRDAAEPAREQALAVQATPSPILEQDFTAVAQPADGVVEELGRNELQAQADAAVSTAVASALANAAPAGAGLDADTDLAGIDLPALLDILEQLLPAPGDSPQIAAATLERRARSAADSDSSNQRQRSVLARYAALEDAERQQAAERYAEGLADDADGPLPSSPPSLPLPPTLDAALALLQQLSN